MNEGTPIYERRPDEPSLWYARFSRYLHLGPSRTLLGTVHAEEVDKGRERQSKKVPGAWYQAVDRYQWRERADAWDREQDAQLEQEMHAERKKVLQSGFAVMHRRVQALDALSRKLLKEASRDDRLWLADVKSIGTGPLAKRVDLVTFNEGLIRQIRGCLDDLASELGERVKKAEVKADVHSSGQIGVYLPEKHDLSEVEAAAPTPEESPPEHEASPYLQMPQKHTFEEQEGGDAHAKSDDDTIRS